MEKKSISFDFEEYFSVEELPEDEKDLLLLASQVSENAHSPYSDFKVGAALKLNNGNVILGVNVENASYGLTICAERTAIGAAVANGLKDQISKIAIYGTGREFNTSEPVTPCGACRQSIKEVEDLSGNSIVLIMSGYKGKILRVVGIDNLLPFGFGPKDLAM